MSLDGGEPQSYLEQATASGTGVVEPLRERAVPGLTILWHPDPGRVGEVAALPGLSSASEPVPLSRLEPCFTMPGESSPCRPLMDRYLSRRPILLQRRSGGGLRIDCGGSKTTLSIDGEPFAAPCRLPDERLERGAVLLLSERVALLLHEVAASARRPPAFGLIGESAAMVRVRQEIQQVADLPITVLLRGESGTGKELVAEAIYRAGSTGGPYLSVNLAAVPAELAAAELFGAAKGAFTGAARRRQGYFQQAQGGTLFLDEIGAAPPAVQTLLLRVLENREIQPVGAERPQPVDVRILAATDVDLEAAIVGGRFRSPLLHRLSSYEILLPPLRHRREDVGRLFVHFLRQALEMIGEERRLEPSRPGVRPWLPASLVARLSTYHWPGNVRQLRNFARQVVVGNRGATTVRVGDAFERLLASTTSRPPRTSAGAGTDAVSVRAPAPERYRDPEDVARGEILEALRANGWSPTRAASALALSRTSLYDCMRRHGIRSAGELERGEIESASERCGGCVGKMARELEVSKRGLKLRMNELGLRQGGS